MNDAEILAEIQRITTDGGTPLPVYYGDEVKAMLELAIEQEHYRILSYLKDLCETAPSTSLIGAILVLETGMDKRVAPAEHS